MPAEALEEQPWLLCSEDFPERPDLLELVRERLRAGRPFAASPPGKLFRHTGKIVIRRLKADPETCEAICWALKLGLSAREVARRFGLSPNTVSMIRTELDEHGELEALGRRLDKKLGRLCEDGLEVVLEGALSGTIHPGQLPIAILAALDKKSQRDAGLVLGTERTKESVTLEQYMARLELAKRLLPAVQADALPTKQAQISAPGAPDTALGSAPALEAELVLVNPSPATPPVTPSASTIGGGGDRSPAPGQESRWERPENSTT